MSTTIDIVKKAILDMKDRTGSSLQAINKWIAANEKVRRKISIDSLFVFIFEPFSISAGIKYSRKPHIFSPYREN